MWTTCSYKGCGFESKQPLISHEINVPLIQLSIVKRKIKFHNNHERIYCWNWQEKQKLTYHYLNLAFTDVIIVFKSKQTFGIWSPDFNLFRSRFPEMSNHIGKYFSIQIIFYTFNSILLWNMDKYKQVWSKVKATTSSLDK